MSLSPGTRLGDYEIVSLLGAGGMGEVYRARDSKLNRDVALKILPEAFTFDAARVARFKREAQVLAALNHPHIAAIYGLDQADHIGFLILELVDGQTLADRIAGGRVPVHEALLIAKQIAEALEAAHEKGIVHRDVKPANIAITAEGRVKVLDFGLARSTESGSGASTATQSPTLSVMATQAGVILGTAAYMSPEQAKGLPVDHRSDVFSFGGVLYEMLTGRQPFHGDTVADVLAAVLIREPDFEALPPNLNPRIHELLKRCLDKHPKHRWQAIGDLRLELESVASTATVPRAHLNGGSKWRPVHFAAVGSAALVAGMVGFFAANRSSATAGAGVTRFTISLPESQRFTGTARTLIDVSPDGRQVVYVANDRLFLRSLSQLESTPIPMTGNGSGILEPVFSPDGKSIAFFSTSDLTLRRVATTGGPAMALGQISGTPTGMSWGPEGILFGTGATILLVNPNGGAPETLITLNPTDLAVRPLMLPGGKAVLYTDIEEFSPGLDITKSHVVVQAIGSQERKVISDAGTDAHYLASGHIVFMIGGVLFARRFDLPRLAATGTATPVVEGVERGGGNVGPVTAHVAMSGTGTLAYVPGSSSAVPGERRLVSIDLAGKTTPLKLPPGFYESPRISPDGRQLAVAIDDSRQANVYIYDLSGATALRQLTFQGHNRNPIWTRDGQRIIFQSDREGDRGMWWQRADGAGVAERLTKTGKDAAHVPESFMPNGETFSFSVIEQSGAVVLNTFSLRERKATPFGDVHSAALLNSEFSPDGKWLAYTLRGTPTDPLAAVYVEPVPPTTAKYKLSAQGGHHPEWSRDGSHLLYFPGPNSLMQAPVSTKAGFAFGEAEAFPGGFRANTSQQSGRNHDIAPDGSHLIAVLLRDETREGGLGGIAQQINVVTNWFEELNARVPASEK